MFNPNGNKNQESNEEFFMSKLQTFNPSRDIYSANNAGVNPKGNNRRKPNRNDQAPKEKKRVPLLDQPVTDNKSSNKKQNLLTICGLQLEGMPRILDHHRVQYQHEVPANH